MDSQPSTSPLDNLTVAKPCHAKWSEMSGDERARFCSLCNKHVYNLSNMSRTEAEALIKAKEGKLCVRFARRADGTIISDNCPVGLRSARDRLRWIGAGAAALFALAGSCVAALGFGNRNTSFKTWFVEPRHNRDDMIMGKLQVLIPTPPPINTRRPSTSSALDD